ncbi:MAG: hypothetical protein EA419_00655 [Wenzhouxiangella sp.]|nr:MAG: hypothetical protein EA419_00655 [Wenzhouxiangella sp.]
MTATGRASRRHWLLIPALVVAGALAASEALRLRQAPDDPVVHLNELAAVQPWGGLAARRASLGLEQAWREGPAETLKALDWALTRYPLDAEAWLLRARLLRETRGLDEQTRLSVYAALAAQPGQRDLQWRALGLAEAFGDAELVAATLQNWTMGRTQNVDRALFAAARWFPDPGERLDRVLPEGEAYLLRAMRYARDQDLPDLAHAVWQRLDPPRAPGERVLEDYLRVQRAAGRSDRVWAVLQTLDPAHERGRLPGGDFSVSLDALDQLGWHLRMPAGVSLIRDENDLPPGLPAPHPRAPLAQASLRLEFSGRENVRLNNPRIRFRPSEPGPHRLTGWWKAERLTTRALPSLDVRLTGGTRVRRSLDLPGPEFDWQPFSVDLDIDETLPVIQFSVVRRDTEAFDRYIAGSLSLAGLRLERVAPPSDRGDAP